MALAGSKVTHPTQIINLYSIELLGFVNPTTSQGFYQNHIDDMGIVGSIDPSHWVFIWLGLLELLVAGVFCIFVLTYVCVFEYLVAGVLVVVVGEEIIIGVIEPEGAFGEVFMLFLDESLLNNPLNQEPELLDWKLSARTCKELDETFKNPGTNHPFDRQTHMKN